VIPADPGERAFPDFRFDQECGEGRHHENQEDIQTQVETEKGKKDDQHHLPVFQMGFPELEKGIEDNRHDDRPQTPEESLDEPEIAPAEVGD